MQSNTTSGQMHVLRSFKLPATAPQGLAIPSRGVNSFERVNLQMSRRGDMIDPEGGKESTDGRSHLIQLARSQHVEQVEPGDDYGPVTYDHGHRRTSYSTVRIVQKSLDSRPV